MTYEAVLEREFQLNLYIFSILVWFTGFFAQTPEEGGERDEAREAQEPDLNQNKKKTNPEPTPSKTIRFS